MTSADLLTLLRGDDIPALVRAVRIDLEYTDKDSARALGFSPDGEWGAVVRDVEAGRAPCDPFDEGYVVRGLVAAWLLRRGGWSVTPGGGYVRSDGARVDGNGMTSWASIPGVRGVLTDGIGEWGAQGPAIRHDCLRLMLRVEAGERPFWSAP